LYNSLFYNTVSISGYTASMVGQLVERDMEEIWKKVMTWSKCKYDTACGNKLLKL